MTNMSFANGSGNLNVNLNFVKTLSEITTKKTDSLLVVGQAKDLKVLDYSHITTILNTLEIPEQWFNESISYLCPKKGKIDESESSASGSSVSWLNKLVMHKISSKCSRNNTPSRAHLITKVVRQQCYSENQIILVCFKKKIYLILN